MSASFHGTVRSGFGSGGYYVSLPHYSAEFRRILHKKPFPGTLNVAIERTEIESYYAHLASLEAITIPEKVENGQHHWKVLCFPCKLSIPGAAKLAEIDCLALDFSHPEHHRGVVELVSTVRLRDHFDLKDGDPIRLDF